MGHGYRRGTRLVHANVRTSTPENDHVDVMKLNIHSEGAADSSQSQAGYKGDRH